MNERSLLPPDFGALVAELSRINCALWHEEDKARSDDDQEVANAKRNIDRLDQRRKDAIEAIDQMVFELVEKRSHG